MDNEVVLVVKFSTDDREAIEDFKTFIRGIGRWLVDDVEVMEAK